MTQRVLVVDDDPIIRELVGEVFRQSGVDVDTAEDGEKCLAALRRRRADLVLLDASMPVMDGFQTLVAIKSDQALSHIPVLMLTAFRAELDVRRALALGASDYIAKPFQAPALLERARRLMGNVP